MALNSKSSKKTETCLHDEKIYPITVFAFVIIHQSNQFIQYFLEWHSVSHMCTRNIVSPQGKYIWQELFKSAQAFVFFLIAPFLTCGTQVVPPPERSGGGGGGVNSVISVSKWFNNKRNDHDEITKYRKH